MAKFSEVDWDNPDNKYRVSFSGGKDSSAMLLKLLELGFPVDSIDYMDVGHDYPEVNDYIEKINNFIQQNYGKSINRMFLKKGWQFEDWFYGKYKRGKREGQMRGFPYVLGACYLSRQKGRTLDRYDRTAYRYIGITYDERRRETDNPRLLYPMIEWEMTAQDGIDYLDSVGLLPKHNKYYTRSGCFWCPMQSIKSSYSLYIRHPDLWEQLKIWESQSPHGWNLEGRTTKDIEGRVKRDLIDGKLNLKDVLDDRTDEEIEQTRERLMREEVEPISMKGRKGLKFN